MARDGYIALYRKIQDNFLWKERRIFSKAEAWIDILMEVRFQPEPTEWIIGNRVLICNYAESLYSLETWARRWGWSKSKTRRVLDLFQKSNMIRLKTETVTIRLTVLNYAEYDPKRNAKEPQEKRKRNASETQVAPKEESKEGKEGKEEKLIARSDAKGNGSEPVGHPFLTIPLTDGTEYPVMETDVGIWQMTYPAVDVRQSLKEIRLWNIDNPKRRKTRDGIRRHIAAWLGREQNRGGGKFKTDDVLPFKSRSESDRLKRI